MLVLVLESRTRGSDGEERLRVDEGNCDNGWMALSEQHFDGMASRNAGRVISHKRRSESAGHLGALRHRVIGSLSRTPARSVFEDEYEYEYEHD